MNKKAINLKNNQDNSHMQNYTVKRLTKSLSVSFLPTITAKACEEKKREASDT